MVSSSTYSLHITCYIKNSMIYLKANPTCIDTRVVVYPQDKNI
jgi:hypothetical protein